MADTRCQLECEDWVRREWMSRMLGQTFHPGRLRLTSGGFFDFDAVSDDGTIVANISTSSRAKRGAGKVMKLRADMLFLVLAAPPRALMIFTEKDMFDWCEKEKFCGRLPQHIEIFHAPLPPVLVTKLHLARQVATDEVSPLRA